MRLLIATERVTEGLLIGALLQTTNICFVKETMVHGSLEAPLGIDPCAATIRNFKPEARLVFYTGCGQELDSSAVDAHDSGWRNRVRPLPTIYVIENIALWKATGGHGRDWHEYLLIRREDNDARKLRKDLGRALQRCAIAIREATPK